MNAPVPYQGKERYIFISYSHRDTDKVFPIISTLMENGYRVWYDQGIDPGTEWDENIAMHINECGYFVAFMSSNYLGSNNCKDELNYARDLEKDRLIVYLENVTLPAGMAMRVNRLQSIFQYTYTNQEDFYEKLFAANNINCCLDPAKAKPKASTAAPKPASPAPQSTTPTLNPLSGSSQTRYSNNASIPRPTSNTTGIGGAYGQNTNTQRPTGTSGYTQGGSYNSTANQGYTPGGNSGYTSGSSTGSNPQSQSTPDGSFQSQNSWAYPIKNKMVAALLAFFLGAIGAHHFYLGQTKIGVIKLIFFWTYIPTFLGIFDAIKLFVMSDDAFCSKYKCRLG